MHTLRTSPEISILTLAQNTIKNIIPSSCMMDPPEDVESNTVNMLSSEKVNFIVAHS